MDIINGYLSEKVLTPAGDKKFYQHTVTLRGG